MELMEALRARHSVRAYDPKPLTQEHRQALEQAVETCNRLSGLHIQLICDEPKAFDSKLAHYGSFSGVANYFALIGKKGPELEEQCGYWGEKLVLKAQQLGLNTCWVALTYKKIPGVFQIDEGEKLVVVIAVGYGLTQGNPRRSKSVEEVSRVEGEMPGWFRAGVEAALLAPTAVNQQKFTFELRGNTVHAKAGLGFYAKMDLGIVKYHFELGAGKENFQWA